MFLNLFSMRTFFKTPSTMNGHQQSPGGSPTIQNMVNRLYKMVAQLSKRSPTIPRIVTRYTKDGHPPPPGGSPKIPGMVNHLSQEGHSQSQGWSPTFPSMVNRHYHPQDGHPPSPASTGWSPTTPRVVTHHHDVGHQKSKGKVPT